jgi:hypothetical protein
MGERVRNVEAVWNALEAWRERTSGDVAIESVGAGWLCRLQAPRCGVAPALCHGADATTAVEGALSVFVLREKQARSTLREGQASGEAKRGGSSPQRDSHVAERAISMPGRTRIAGAERPLTKAAGKLR